MPLTKVAVNVERGRFRLINNAVPSGNTLHTQYHYGFASDIGAGAYQRRRSGPDLPSPTLAVAGGDPDLTTKLGMVGATGTIQIGDSLTYSLSLPATQGGIANVALISKDYERPVIRIVAGARPEWTFSGAASTSSLLIEGQHLFGSDLVLAGQFDKVTIRCSTLDPGTSGQSLPTPALFAAAADNQTLWPTRLFVDGQIKTLVVERAITGPIRTRNGGAITGTLQITVSIVQSLPESSGGLLTVADVRDPEGEI